MTVTLRVELENIVQILRRSSTSECQHLHVSEWENEDFREEAEIGIDNILTRWHYFGYKGELLRVKEAALLFRGQTYHQPSMAQYSVECEVVDRAKFLFETITEDKIRALIQAGDKSTLNILWGV